MILKKIKIEFELPDEGSHLAVLVDIPDLGEKMTTYGLKNQLRFKWLVQQTGKDGKQLSVITTYNKTLGEGASLVQAITDITGKPVRDEFDTETLIGANARLTIKHQKKPDGRVYANVVAILRPGKGDPVLSIPEWFQRGADSKKTPPSTPSTPIANFPTSTEQQKKAESVPEPPDPSEFDQATSFPGGNTASDEHAA